MGGMGDKAETIFDYGIDSIMTTINAHGYRRGPGAGGRAVHQCRGPYIQDAEGWNEPGTEIG